MMRSKFERILHCRIVIIVRACLRMSLRQKSSKKVTAFLELFNKKNTLAILK